MLLVKFDDNWADEMDVSGFKLFDNLDAWNAAIAWFKEEKGLLTVRTADTSRYALVQTNTLSMKHSKSF